MSLPNVQKGNFKIFSTRTASYKRRRSRSRAIALYSTPNQVGKETYDHLLTSASNNVLWRESEEEEIAFVMDVLQEYLMRNVIYLVYSLN